jgi:hypothetical protein
MSLHSWLQILRSALTPGRDHRHPTRRGSLRAATHRLNVEALEDRCVPAFLAPVDYAVGAGPFEVKAGDFNGDGTPDLATANAFTRTVSVLLSNGDGTFQPARDTPIGPGWFSGPGPFSLAVGDFNEDGKLDIATANYPSDSGITILLGQGDGTFVQGPTPFNSASEYTIGAGDLNSDGHLDLVATSVWDDFDTGATVTYVDVRLGHGDGTFVFDRWYGAYDGELRALELADFDGDGKVDLVADQYSAHGAYWGTIIFRGNGDGTLQEPSAFGTDLGSMADFNADGNLDRAYFTSYMNQLALAVSLGNGDGSFAPPILTPVASDLGSIALFAVADFNADGRPDVAVNFPYADKVTVLLNDGVWDGPPTPLPPSLRIDDLTVTEGNAGTVAATLTVTLSAASSETITVAYATGNGTATSGSDYQAASGTLIFAPGETSKTIAVPVIGDHLAEPNETFVIDLSSPTNATIGDSQGVGTIVDDEPRISISEVTKPEGKKGQTTLFTFTVTLSAAYDQPVTVSFRTVNGTATTSDNDYVAKTGTLTFAPGETTKTITIEVKGDNKKEANETFYLELFGNSGNSLFTKNRGLGTILNDD